MSLAAERAEQIIRELGVRDPADLRIEDIAWERRALVRDEPIDGSVARVVAYGDRAMITVSTSIREPGRRRFAIAHEIGHLELHPGTSDLYVCLDSDLDPKARALRKKAVADDPEQDANKFASALLMPEPLFRPRCEKKRPCFALIDDLAATFQTSVTATAIRCTSFCGEACAVVYSADRRIRWYWPSRDFEFHVRVGEEVDRHSIADDCFAGKAVPPRLTRVDASCWLAAGRYKDDAMILEESRGLPTYNAVLTLLWIDQDIEREWEPRERFAPDGRYRRR
jgi:hypothetical protein